MLGALQVNEQSMTPTKSLESPASKIPMPTSPPAKRTGHARSASILSSSSSVSIPSRSSSVLMSPTGIPVRNSSIADSPLRSRKYAASGPAMPASASDLADTIASLTLGDLPASPSADTRSLNRNLHAAISDSNLEEREQDARTPQPPSGFFPASTHSPGFHPAPDPAPATPTTDSDFRKASLLELGEEIGDAHDAIQVIQSHMFAIQEQRHGIRAGLQGTKEEAASDTSTLGGLDLSLMQLDEKLEALSRSMQQLEVRFGELRDPSADTAETEAGDTSIIDREMGDWQARARRNSVASIDSLCSLDDMALPGFAPALTSRALYARYDTLCSDWTSIQEEVEALKKELADDKYLDVFRSISIQAEGMMDSLDKAVSLCNTFVQQVQRNHLAGKLQRAAAVQDDFEGDYDIEAKQDELVALTKTFDVKKSYYLPACQQVFLSLEKGCKERQSANGTILRRLSDLRSRWRNLRDELAKTERDLKRMEALFRRVRSDSSGSSAAFDVPSPATSIASLPSQPHKLRTSASMQSSLGLGTPTRSSASSASRVGSGPSVLSSSSSMTSKLASIPPAAATSQRLRRISTTAESLGMHNKPVSTPSRTGATRQLEVPRSKQVTGSRFLGGSVSPSAIDSPIRNRATSMANAATGAVEKGVLGRSPTGRPLSIVGSRVAAADRDVSSTPNRPPPSSFKPSWHDLETPGANRTRSSQPQSMPRSQSQVLWPPSPETSAGRQDPDDSIEYLKFAADATPARPASAAGQFYRPPSAQGSVGDAKTRKRDSLIPRLSVRDSEANSTPSRPSSALSHSSSSTPIRYSGASRSSMQTPEPAIVARAQRLSMYARAPSTGIAGFSANTPNKRASKPPPTRRNAALVSGRATPLSAAALASLPASDPNPTLRRSSNSNLRLLNNGRTTPTFSDNGSVGGMSTGTWYGPGRGARGVSGAGSRIGSGSVAGSNYGAAGPIEEYRANPNDALDVEVAAICNGLGVALERIDAPLPRGVKLEEGPGKDNRAQYEIGGRAMMCRLLELHRPAGGAGARAGTKAKKILVRVGGGWQDLEQWLLGRLSSS